MFFIAGSTGFVGRHLVQALDEKGQRGRCLVRTPGKSEQCKKYGFEAVAGDITGRESLKGKLAGSTVVVHLVGIIEEKDNVTFEHVHVTGTKNLIDEAKQAGIKHFFYQSALGASLSSKSRYLKTKAEAEEIVKASGIPYTIFRPSLIVGKGDGFTERMKELIRLGPVVPVPGSGTARFQPIYIGDWIKCFMSIFSNPLPIVHKDTPVYEFGGPEHLTYDELLTQLMEALDVRKPLMHVPLAMLKMSLPFSKITRSIGGLVGKNIPSVTGEQLELLRIDNICDRAAVKKYFGFSPLSYREALKLFVKER